MSFLLPRLNVHRRPRTGPLHWSAAVSVSRAIQCRGTRRDILVSMLYLLQCLQLFTPGTVHTCRMLFQIVQIGTCTVLYSIYKGVP